MAWLDEPLLAADYSPDMPAYNNPGSANILNAIPRTPTSYGPFASLANFGGAISAQCQGAFACSDSGDNNYVFCGSAADLYEYTGITPSVVSKGTSPYNCLPTQFWKFFLFGQRVLATDYADPIQSFVLNSSTVFADLANGNIPALTLTAGANYTNGTYSLSVTNGGSGSSFAGTVTISAGQLSSYSITNVGKLYPQTATISIPAGANPNGIYSLTLVGGSGYTNGTYPLSVSGGSPGTGFTGTVTVSGGALTSSSVTTEGNSYPLTATIPIPGGAGGGTGGSITPNFITGGAITPTIQTIAPQAQFMDIAKGFLICGNTYDPVYGVQDQRVWWSALNDPTNFPTPGTTLAAEYQSSYNDLLGNGGSITGVVGNLGTADIAVFLEHEVWRGIYAGPPVIFDFFPAEGVRGTRMPNSIIHLGPIVYYIGEDGFYVFDGTNSEPIGTNKVDKTFFANLNQNYLNNVWGAADPLNKVVYWLYPSTSASSGVPDSIIMYNWQLQKWSAAQTVSETIFRAQAFGYTLDELNAFGTLDQITLPFDSRAWIGGGVILAGFDVNHKLSYFNGSNLQATIETTEVAPFDSSYAFINNTRPLIDGSSPLISIATRNRLIDTALYGTPTGINSIGTCPLTANGRYIRAQITIPAGSSWTHFQGVEMDARANGVQ